VSRPPAVRDGQAVPVQELGVGDAFAAVSSSARGLTQSEAVHRLTVNGRNELPRSKHASPITRFAAQFTDLFAIVLLVAAVVTLLSYLVATPRDVGNLQLSAAIAAVVVLNAVIGFMQEYMAERTAETLQAMVPHRAVVVRDGARVEVPAAELVIGDLVVVEAGDALSADCRVVEAHELTVNNMALTGESDPVGRDAGPAPAGIARLEARNLVWMGTVVSGGTGKAVVVATGAATEFGRIFRLTTDVRADRSPLQRQIAIMARRVAVAAFALGALLFVVRLPEGDSLTSTFVFALGVMVALVPEGLPATMSVALAIGVRRMARRHALIKKLLAVETLGSTTVICTDKTGTLTKAEMTVQAVWAGGRTHRVSGVGYAPEGEVEDADEVRELLYTAGLCCDARLLPPEGRLGWRILGDTTEGALLVAATKAGVDLAAQPRVGEFPFDSARKLMTTLHRVDGGVRAYVKGAPQELLARCTHIRVGADTVVLDDELRRQVLAANDDMARSALRVLAVASRQVSSARAGQDEVEQGLTLLGLAGMLDPPRPEVVAAVRACRHAGIRVVMVTGDYALTAEAIARKVGILPSGAVARTVTGVELDAVDDDSLRALLTDSPHVLFARVKPEHKMRVVGAFKDLGEVVAVTGDGANDAPALKRADIGVSMGESGTDVAREASVMVLLDDSFASIAAAVELGRSVYANIRKFLIYLFSHNMGELVPILVATFAGFPLVPITTLQILAIDLGADVLPALALGAEPPEPGTMDLPPRRRTQTLFSGALVRRFLFLGGIQAVGVTIAFFWTLHATGVPFAGVTAQMPGYREAITMTQAAIVVSQLFNGLTVRSERHSIVHIGLFSNPLLLAAQGVSILLICAISYTAPLQALFHTAPLSLADWALLIALGAMVLVADEIRKFVLRRRETPA